MNSFFSRNDFVATKVAMVTAAAVYPLLVVTPKLLGYGVLRPFFEPFVMLAVFWSESAPSVGFVLDLATVFPVVVGLLILVVAECFRIGTRIRDDVEGLV